jgi:glyoxylase-like metal-dependent hydrolase (beta-lactamase superfamily II)
MKDVFVNIYMVQNPVDGKWVLVDCGLKWSASKIKKMAALLFGMYSRPSAIILTHGHFDHVGSLKTLVREWDVPVYAHFMEMPYLTGKSSYPPPDSSVGGGLLSAFSWMFPKGSVNIEGHVNVLPSNGNIPDLPEWQAIHTPGHAPGHISLYRKADGVLLAGDAFVTTRQESLLSVMMQTKVLSGPPKYFTSDWGAAASSVAKLAALQPETVATGHGSPMAGPNVRKSLHNLSLNFKEKAIPAKGRYVQNPAITDENGIVHLPENERNQEDNNLWKIAGVSAFVALTAFLIYKQKAKSRYSAGDYLNSLEYE